MPTLNVAEAFTDRHLFEPSFRGPSWGTWLVILKAAFGLPLSLDERAVFRIVAERDPPSRRVRELWIIGGRRGGKDLIASFLIAYFSSMFDPRGRLRRGERALCACLAVDREQAKIVLNYTRGHYEALPLLRRKVERLSRSGLDLSNSVDIAVTTNSFRSVRGRPILSPVLDEVAFWRDDRSATPDEETYSALVPGTLTIPESMIIGISTPYRKSGLLWRKYRESFGRDDPDVLVIRAASAVLNPLVDQAAIDRDMEKDPARARAEYLVEFRSDISGFLDPELVEALVDRGVRSRPRIAQRSYYAFVDMSGGQGDSSVLAIAHLEPNDVIFLDRLEEKRSPHDPTQAIREFAEVLREYGLHEVMGDDYAAGFPKAEFLKHGITLRRAELVSADKKTNRSELYLESLPLFNARRVRLLDDRRFVAQLGSLERSPGANGRDRVDHPTGGHDDLANAACGAVVRASGRRPMIVSDELLARSAQPARFSYGRSSAPIVARRDDVVESPKPEPAAAERVEFPERPWPQARCTAEILQRRYGCYGG